LHAKAGDILTFDSNLLHGATKPKTRRRMSFDFRLAPAASVAAAPPSVRRIFDAVNQNLSLSNARNLARLGDKPGAERIFRRLGLNPPAIEPGPRIAKPDSQMRWQDEYAYLRAADGRDSGQSLRDKEKSK
jgi:hypothetical protein